MENYTSKSTPFKLDKLFQNSLQNLKERSESEHWIPFITTGFKCLDDLIGGWKPGELVVLGARPGMGKTALFLSMIREISLKSEHAVGLISLEISREVLIEKIISIESGISLIELRKAKFSDQDWEKLGNAYVESMQRQVYIVEEPREDLESLIKVIKDLAENAGVKVVFIDFLQLIGGNLERVNRERMISSAIKALRKLAEELDIAIIVASQLNRSTEVRSGNKRPGLADLKDSGSIEENADKVIFIHRPEVYGMETDECGNSLKGIAEIIVTKNRSSPCGEIRLNFNISLGCFYEPEKRPGAYGNVSDDNFPKKFPPF